MEGNSIDADHGTPEPPPTHPSPYCCRVETESGGTRRLTGGEVKEKEANGVGSQQSSA